MNVTKKKCLVCLNFSCHVQGKNPFLPTIINIISTREGGKKNKQITCLTQANHLAEQVFGEIHSHSR